MCVFGGGWVGGRVGVEEMYGFKGRIPLQFVLGKVSRLREKQQIRSTIIKRGAGAAWPTALFFFNPDVFMACPCKKSKENLKLE
jgi:hypothetical protein